MYIQTPFIFNGYKLNGKFTDLFSWHNETINAWTLLIIPLFSIFFYIFHNLPFISILLPLHAIIHAPFSIGNHLFRGCDYITHTLWRTLDLSATHISSFILCICLGFHFYSTLTFCAIIFTQFLVCVYLLSLEYKHFLSVKNGSSPYWNRTTKTLLVAIEVFIYLLPVIYHKYWHIPLSLIIGGIFYSLGIPERYFPYTFDYIGNGNNIMHITLLYAHYHEYKFIMELVKPL